MKAITGSYLMLWLIASVAASLPARKWSEQHGTHLANSENGRVALEVHSFGLVLEGLGKKSPRLHVFTLYDPTSRLYWWMYERRGSERDVDRLAEFNERFYVQVTSEAIAAVEITSPPPGLWILSSKAKAASSMEVEAVVMNTLLRKAKEIQSGSYAWLRRVNLWGHLPVEFFFDPLNARPRLDAVVTGLESAGSGWMVFVSGRSGLSARAILDSRLSLVRVELEKGPKRGG